MELITATPPATSVAACATVNLSASVKKHLLQVSIFDETPYTRATKIGIVNRCDPHCKLQQTVAPPAAIEEGTGKDLLRYVKAYLEKWSVSALGHRIPAGFVVSCSEKIDGCCIEYFRSAQNIQASSF